MSSLQLIQKWLFTQNNFRHEKVVWKKLLQFSLHRLDAWYSECQSLSLKKVLGTYTWKLLNFYFTLAVSNCFHKYSLKLVSAIFIKFLLFHQMIALQKLWKMLISSKMLFSFSRYFCISVLPSFSACRPLLEEMMEEKS